jgi:glycolate oxidase FAD binding subunit
MREAFLRTIQTACEQHSPLCLRGAGSKDFYGNALQGEWLDVRAYAGIVAYEPTELYVTAKCGTPLAEIEAVLAAQGQCLAFEPPRFAADSTIGGVVAAGLSGPRRAHAGAVRDFLLGVKLIDGAARELSFGGQVMKNVAGYDVSRVIAGSMGTLGLILEVTLKVLPQPVMTAVRCFNLSQAAALDQLNRWAAQPLPITASAWQDGVLRLRLAGARSAVVAALQKVGGDATAQADDFGAGDAFWDDLRDQRLPWFATAESLWRLSLPANVPPLDLPGETLLEWGGALRWLRSTLPAASIRGAAAAVGGSATLYRAPAALKTQCGAFQPLPEPLMALHRRLKAAFDPHGILNPGRLYPEL